MRCFTLGIALALLATSAVASDGIIEINSICALQTGCFSGDVSGYPVTIRNPGSYRLTSDLARSGLLGGIDPSTILIIANDVTLDFAGFTMSCRPLLGTCSGLARGIDTTSGFERTTVKNGAIVGMPAAGMVLGDGSIVRNMRVIGSGRSGIAVGVGSLVSDNVALDNSDAGILAGGTSGYRGNVLIGNGTTVGGFAVNLGGNLCGTNTSCP